MTAHQHQFEAMQDAMLSRVRDQIMAPADGENQYWGNATSSRDLTVAIPASHQLFEEAKLRRKKNEYRRHCTKLVETAAKRIRLSPA